jgi:predicted flap endonuclease-1-like 5' DNA nuclease
MKSDLERQACTQRCWWTGAAVGLFAAFVMLAFIGWSLIAAILVGLVVAGLVGALLRMVLCAAPAGNDVAAQEGRAADDRAEATGAALASTSMAAGAGAAVARPAPISGAAVADAAAEERAEDHSAGTTTPVEFVSTSPEPEDPAQPEAQAAAQKADPAAPAVPDTPAPAARTKTEPARAKPAADGAPETLDGPRGGHADDLKKITGVGPKMEQTLNELGIFHYDQIASWGAEEIAWVDSRLRFKGRIVRDGWIAQARAFAAADQAGSTSGTSA